MLSPILFILWLPVVAVAAILIAGALVLGAAVGIDEAVRGRPAVPPRAGRPAVPAMPAAPAQGGLGPARRPAPEPAAPCAVRAPRSPAVGRPCPRAPPGARVVRHPGRQAAGPLALACRHRDCGAPGISAIWKANSPAVQPSGLPAVGRSSGQPFKRLAIGKASNPGRQPASL
jgi:hypothetical protein